MTDDIQTADSDGYEIAPEQSTLNPLRMFLRRKWLVALGVFTGAVLGALFYSRAAPIYQSYAQVLVVKKTPDALPMASADGHVSAAEDYLSTHQTLIRSPVIVLDAVQKGDLRSLKSFAGRGDTVGEIINSLKVSREINGSAATNILNISFRGPVAEDSAAVVKAVIKSYQSFLSARYKSVSDETAKLITDASTILEKKITERQQEYNKFSIEHPTLWRGKDGVSMVQDRMLTLEAKRVALLMQEMEIKGRLEVFEKAVKDGRHTRSELLAMIAQTRKAGGDAVTTASTLEDRIMTLELQEKTLLEDYGDNYPPLRSVRRQLTLLRAQAGRLNRGNDNDEDSRLDPVAVHIQTLKLELENTKTTAATLASLLKHEQSDAKESRSAEKQDESYRAEILRSQMLFDAVSKRLDEVSILKNFAGGYEAETIAPAAVGLKVYPRPTLVFATALVLGLLAGFGLAYVAELSDHSFRAPEEVRRQLALPIMGHIPAFGPADDNAATVDVKGPKIDPMLRAVHQPKSIEAEAYRGVRTALYFSSRSSGSKVIQVTSPDMGDGKSTLAANLAVSIAQSEKKVILIDADFRRPRVHKLFGVPAKVGLKSVITGEAELNDAIQATAVPGLFVLPCGPIPPNPAELLTLTQFSEILKVIREQYDFVIIDTPPLLAVTDPCVVVPHVDGVILTLRISKNARPHALRAKEILATLGASILGLVVNGMVRGKGGYGYDDYRYGYTYKSYNYYSYDQGEYSSSEESNGEVAEVNGSTPPASSSASRRKGFLNWLIGG